MSVCSYLGYSRSNGGPPVRGKMAKPARRQAKQERTQETIAVVLEAAAQVLEREGYARATTNRIATIAGVSVGTIYQYFSNKDEIFDALILRELHVLQRLLRDAAPRRRTRDAAHAT